MTKPKEWLRLNGFTSVPEQLREDGGNTEWVGPWWERLQRRLVDAVNDGRLDLAGATEIVHYAQRQLRLIPGLQLAVSHGGGLFDTHDNESKHEKHDQRFSADLAVARDLLEVNSALDTAIRHTLEKVLVEDYGLMPRTAVQGLLPLRIAIVEEQVGNFLLVLALPDVSWGTTYRSDKQLLDRTSQEIIANVARQVAQPDANDSRDDPS
jgi:hypothetical protein